MGVGQGVLRYLRRDSAHKMGKIDEHGNKITNPLYANSYKGKLFNSRNEALNVTTSTDEGVGQSAESVETKKRNGLFSNNGGNIFGN